jgi:hypothetical protein
MKVWFETLNRRDVEKLKRQKKFKMDFFKTMCERTE